MRWEKLAENKCPKCHKDLTKGVSYIDNKQGRLIAHGCGFRISEKKMEILVNEYIAKDHFKSWKESNGVKW